MEQKFGKNSIDIKVLREFCEREGKMVEYRKGEQLEREGDPARWFGFVTEGCFKYVTHGISDDREHITWFSFEGEFAGDYPACLDGGPALTTIEAMVPTRIIRVSGEQLVKRFSQDKKSMDLRHSPTVVTHPQGRHVFGEIIPNIHKTPEHLFRLSPTFCNFVARNDSRRRLQHDVNAPNEIFPRKRRIK